MTSKRNQETEKKQKSMDSFDKYLLEINLMQYKRKKEISVIWNLKDKRLKKLIACTNVIRKYYQ